MMPEFLIGAEFIVILALVGYIVSQNARLMRAAMSRTPGEYRAAEKAAAKKMPVPTSPKNLVEFDEDVQKVLQAVSPSNPMPHGLGGD